MNIIFSIALFLLIISNVITYKNLREVRSEFRSFKKLTDTHNFKGQIEELNYTYEEIHKKFLDCWNKLIESVTLLETIENEFKNKQE